MSESATRSREEGEELQRSTKKVKENHCSGTMHAETAHSSQDGNISYKEKLLGEIPGAFEPAFNFEFNMDTEVESGDEFSELSLCEKVVRFSGNMKTKIRAPWANALIVKVFGKTVGYHFLHSRILSLWKPTGKMDCVDLGNDLFLITFQLKEDSAKVLREGPWFVEGHYLSIRCWEPNFKASKVNLSSVVVWIQLLELPIEYYEPSALREIGEAIGPVLRIDAHTTAESRGRFARLCVQVNFNEPIIKLLKMGGIDQPVPYEGIHSLCFACGRVGHKEENCPYKINSSVTEGTKSGVGNNQEATRQNQTEDAGDAFGP